MNEIQTTFIFKYVSREIFGQLFSLTVFLFLLFGHNISIHSAYDHEVFVVIKSTRVPIGSQFFPTC